MAEDKSKTAKALKRERDKLALDVSGTNKNKLPTDNRVKAVEKRMSYIKEFIDKVDRAGPFEKESTIKEGSKQETRTRREVAKGLNEDLKAARDNAYGTLKPMAQALIFREAVRTDDLNSGEDQVLEEHYRNRRKALSETMKKEKEKHKRE